MSTLRAALYTKNVPPLERALRVAFSLSVSVGALLLFSGALRLAVVASALGFLLTGLVGFCPLCAVAGRKLKTS